MIMLRMCCAGLEETDALRLRGQGHSGRYGGTTGDVYLSFMVRLMLCCLLQQRQLLASLIRDRHSTAQVVAHIWACQVLVSLMRLHHTTLVTTASCPSQLKADPGIRREGTELYSTLQLPYLKAILGGTVRVTTLNGEADLHVPPGESH